MFAEICVGFGFISNSFPLMDLTLNFLRKNKDNAPVPIAEKSNPYM
jgi:hypothetical protein